RKRQRIVLQPKCSFFFVFESCDRYEFSFSLAPPPPPSPSFSLSLPLLASLSFSLSLSLSLSLSFHTKSAWNNSRFTRSTCLSLRRAGCKCSVLRCTGLSVMHVSQ